MQFYNVHTHIFTMNNAPRRFLELYLPKWAAHSVDKITNTQVGAWLVKKLLNTVGGHGGKRYASFLEIGKSSSQNDVFRHLIESYEDSSIKMVALTLFMEKLGADASMSGYEGQLEEIIALKRRYPERLLPFFCIDPRWKNDGAAILATTQRYFDRKINVSGKEYSPFAGIKIYPSTGFYPFDAKLMPVMEWAAKNGVPVMTHCSYLGGIFNNDVDFVKASLNPYDPYDRVYYDKPCYISGDKKARVNNQRSCSYFLEPHAYESMIRYFAEKGTPLKICFAHFGSDKHMLLEHKKDQTPQKYYGVLADKNWTAQIKDLMTRYPEVYTDISYSLTKLETHDFIFEELRNAYYGDRILFGTDFFMTEREEKEQKTYTHFKSRALKEKNVSDAGNAWEKIAMLNPEQFLKSNYYQT
ncbi:MAG TPA: amidohydrolase family protein [Flavipsychrobacter sp.]|nr:amidohydrolase family protein [Flavipsychrobacter sp.]